MPFHHAYNFVPAPSRPAEADAEPHGHDHLGDGLWHGQLEVSMTVRTPLIVGEYGSADERGHRSVHLRSRSGRAEGAADGADVEIPVTSVKGMLRSSFEALTRSRFGVLDAHDVPLTYRAQAAEAVRLMPVRIVRRDGAWLAEPMLGTRQRLEDDDEPLPAAMLPDTQQTGSYTCADGGLARLRALAHGTEVAEATLTRMRHRRGYEYWMVTSVGGMRCVWPARESTVEPTDQIEIEGYVCRTNPGPLHHPQRPVVRGKHDERFFFDYYWEEHHPLPVSEEVAAGYRLVVQSGVAAFNGPQRAEVPSRAVAAVLAEKSDGGLRYGDLVYAVLVQGEITELVPSMIGRRHYARSPRDLLAPAGLLPPEHIGEASPADRVFGLVRDPHAGPVPDHLTDRVAARGSVVLSPVHPVDVRLSRQPKTLRELSTPKPAAGRFYVRDKEHGRLPTRLRKSDLYTSGQTLGRKVYPHHRDPVLDGDDFPASAQVTEPTERNVTASTWVAPGGTFSFMLRFTNLPLDAVGALLWLLTPEEIGVPGEDCIGYHRLGRGRPLGLGSVEVRATGVQLVDTATLRSAYRNLDGCLGTVGPQPGEDSTPQSMSSHLIQSFRQAYAEQVGGPFDEDLVIVSLRRAFSGYADGLRVAYPAREGGGEAGPIVAWFTHNEKADRDGTVPAGQSLPSLVDPEPLT